MGSETARISLQEFADRVVAPEYRQPLKSVDEMIALQGWESAIEPMCCGAPVNVQAMIGDPYFAECGVCGKFAAAADAPSFSPAGNSVSFVDAKLVDCDTDKRWIVGAAPRNTERTENE